MAYRVIQDDVPISTSLNQLSHFGERLYWRLLSQTDAWGRLPGDLVKIRDLAIPRLAVSDSELAATLEELVRAARITLYCADGVWAVQLLDFDRHQLVGRMKRAASRWPAPPQTDMHSEPEHPFARTKALEKPGSTDRDSKTVERSLPTVVVQDVELPISQNRGRPNAAHDERLRFGHVDLVELSHGLRGGDERTPYAIASVLKGMPEAALASAIEQLERRRQKHPRIQSEVRYLVGTLSTMRREGQYS